MKKFVWGTLLAVLGLVGLFVSGGRGSGELRGYFRASADKTVDGLVASLPKEIYHYWGTAWSAIGLLETLGKPAN